MGFAALKLASEIGRGFLRSFASEGTCQGVRWKAARPIDRKIRTMTTARRSFWRSLGFLGAAFMGDFLEKVSHKQEDRSNEAAKEENDTERGAPQASAPFCFLFHCFPVL